MARPDGVAIVSERSWCFSRLDGAAPATGQMPRPPELFARLPLVRGLARLGVSLAPLVARRGVARGGERLVLLAALLAPIPIALVPSAFRPEALAVVIVALLAWMLRGAALRLHGAEHRAIAACEERRLVSTWAGDAKPSRFSPRCGTNFAALAVPVTLLADRTPLPVTFWSPLVVLVLSLALTMELWRVVQSRSVRLLLLPGLALQRLTTREPRLDETHVALRAVASVVRRELELSQ
jgi:uncharacterized protein YqhQ